MSLPSRSIQRPVAVSMLFAAVTFLGLISVTRLPVDLLPDISYPRLVIYTQYPDMAPAEVEQQVTRPIENAAGQGVQRLERIESISR
ncbi:MAG TPA: efflux RND transporter permease subunit, partial [Longimicrobiales bacterium]|nr:efflux RND transporter permease subunit [Longimicrobiales bacterium]